MSAKQAKTSTTKPTSTKTTASTKGRKATKTAKPRTIQVIEDSTPEIATPISAAQTSTIQRSVPETRTKRLSALDAAVLVLRESNQPLNAKQLVEAMTSKGYWTSPGGKTPHATLFSAIQREVDKKGVASRFTKAERGKFALSQAGTEA